MAEAHIRIDEGVKRGPRKRNKPPVRRDESGQVEAIPANLDPKEVLDLYLQYPTTSGIAAKLGLRRSSLTLWLRKTCPEDWRNVQLAKAHMRKEDGDEGIETASDALALARAREMLKSGQWDLERLDPKNYGQKQEVTHNLQPVLNIVAPMPQVAVQQGEVIDVVPTQIAGAK